MTPIGPVLNAGTMHVDGVDVDSFDDGAHPCFSIYLTRTVDQRRSINDLLKNCTNGTLVHNATRTDNCSSDALKTVASSLDYFK